MSEKTDIGLTERDFTVAEKDLDLEKIKEKYPEVVNGEKTLDKNREEMLDKLHDETIKSCPMLYSGTGRCWECGSGWYNVLADASRQIEGLNVLGRPYGVKIVSSQIKEKFGTLRWYYDIVRRQTFPERVIGKILPSFNYDFKMQRVEIEPPSTYQETREVTQEEYDEANKSRWINAIYTKDEKTGKFYRTITVQKCAKVEYRPTRLKAFYRLRNRILDFKIKFGSLMDKIFDSNDQDAIVALLESKMDEIVNKAEKACWRVCERCGRTIGEDWSPRVETSGWITYICQECAARTIIERQKWNERQKDEQKDPEEPMPAEEAKPAES